MEYAMIDATIIKFHCPFPVSTNGTELRIRFQECSVLAIDEGTDMNAKLTVGNAPPNIWLCFGVE